MFFAFVEPEKCGRGYESSKWVAVSVSWARVGGVGRPSLRDYKLGGFIFMGLFIGP